MGGTVGYHTCHTSALPHTQQYRRPSSLLIQFRKGTRTSSLFIPLRKGTSSIQNRPPQEKKGHGTAHHTAGQDHAPKSNTRNRIFSTNCTRNA
eukprot:3459672-Rhodomonas_salina.1